MYRVHIFLNPPTTSVTLSFKDEGLAKAIDEKIYLQRKALLEKSEAYDAIMVLKDEYGHVLRIDPKNISHTLLSDAAKDWESAHENGYEEQLSLVRVRAKAQNDPMLNGKFSPNAGARFQSNH